MKQQEILAIRVININKERKNHENLIAIRTRLIKSKISPNSATSIVKPKIHQEEQPLQTHGVELENEAPNVTNPD